MKKCKDCKKIIDKESVRCRACNCKRFKKHYFCRDCKAEIGRRTIRCLTCYKKKREREAHVCLDCGKKIGRAIRCRECRAKFILKEEEDMKERTRIWAEKRRIQNG